jgi:hypothetical protein
MKSMEVADNQIIKNAHIESEKF